MHLEQRRSAPYWKRQEMMKELTVPTISEAKEHLGAKLAEVVLEQSTECQKVDLGLKPPLIGPVGPLWTSPSDLLLGKVCLKPPLTQKHIQALTHEGILDMGYQIEKKYRTEMEAEKKEIIEEAETRLRRVFEIEKTRMMTEAMEEAEKKHSEEMESMKIGFENKINSLIEDCQDQVGKLEEMHSANVDSLNELWQEKLDGEIRNTVEKMTEEFLEKMRLQEQVLVGAFRKQVNNLKAKYKCARDFDKIRNKEMILQLRHNLECQNVANLMYVLCKERRKCKGEKKELEKYYESQLRNRERKISSKSRAIRRLTKVKDGREKQLEVREKILVEILRQFQKFIYYALKASPTQGEFLLNIDKLIKFELEDHCFEKRKKMSRPAIVEKREEPQIVDVNAFLAAHCEDEIGEKEEEGEEKAFEESDVLPAFYFDEKIYVREDFRDMFSAGVEIDDKHPLWNKDVEELVDIFKATIDKKRSQLFTSSVNKIKSQHSSVRFHRKRSSSEAGDSKITTQTEPIDIVEIPSLLPSPSPPISLVKKTSSEFEEKEIRKVSMAGWSDAKEIQNKIKKKVAKEETNNESRRNSLIKSQLSQEDELVPRMRGNSATQSRLTLARDSIILHLSNKEKKSLANVSKIILAKEALKNGEGSDKKSLISEPFEIKASVRSDEGSSVEIKVDREEIKSEKSLTVDSSAPSDSRHTSKLLLVQDSIELIKSNMGLTEKCSRQASKRSQLTFSNEVKESANKRGAKRVNSKSVKKAASKQPTARIAGSKKSKEHEKTSEVFTEERVKSLVNLMKENPSLIRLFTACSK